MSEKATTEKIISVSGTVLGGATLGTTLGGPVGALIGAGVGAVAAAMANSERFSRTGGDSVNEKSGEPSPPNDAAPCH